MEIRQVTPADHEGVTEVNRQAFSGSDEADLVACLRRDGDALVELVALERGRVVGHVLFSRLGLERAEGSVAAAALAPLAVLPDRQRRGIGTALVWHGLDACRAAQLVAVVVLGHPEYYPKFGFSARLAERLAAPFEGPAFMALELVPGALERPARVRYAAAFRLPG